MIRQLIICAMVPWFFACQQQSDSGDTLNQKPPAKEKPDLYFGGDIITMDGDSVVYAEALITEGGRIRFVGSKQDAMDLINGACNVIDLAGKTLLPGFIDPHSHFINSLGMSEQANCSSPPVGSAGDPAGIVDALRKFRDAKNIAAGKLIMGYGYDDTQMPQGNLLNRDVLDEAFPDNPVLVLHVSLHGGVMNSMAQKAFGISAATQTPPGGVIVRKPGTSEPYGLIMETAFLPVFASLPKPTPEQLVAQIKAGQMIYAAAGVTTAQEGASHLADIDILQSAADSGLLFLDVVSYPFITEFDTLMQLKSASDFGTYRNRFKLGGIKITIDGSPQGRTAYFTTPYLTGGPGGEKNWRGSPTFSQETVNEMLQRVYDAGLQCIFHANGDAAIDMCIKAHEYASKGDYSKDRRTTVIHSQFVRPDQLDVYVKEGLLASFYTEHTFFFADAHIRNRGEKQAFFISPMRTALRKGLHITNHTDFNVAPIDQMLVVWSAVNRISREGQAIGPEECITPYQALQAITASAAYQNFEELQKGRLRKGFLADLVILDKNPLKVDPMTIRDIRVEKTIKEGRIIYARQK